MPDIMSNVDEQISLFRERLENDGIQQDNTVQKTSLFLKASEPDAMRLLQGDITKLLTQAKLQDGFDLTSIQKAALEELRAEVRQRIADVKPSVVKSSWTEVRQQAESTGVSAQSIFKKWAHDKHTSKEERHKPEGPEPSNKK
jgi:hypothetical protein|tara:strand:- start:77462 stop:77890 length:429 start_codon:yes stop_codon:yes gene_type:complete